MTKAPATVSIVVFPECDPSIVFGVFDTLWAAGRMTGDVPEQPLFAPRLIGAARGPIELVTGVSIITQDGVNDVGQTDIVFVPNVIVDTPASLRALDRQLIDWVDG